MKKTVLFLAAALALLPLSARASSAAGYFGTWKVIKIAGYADISVGDDIAKKGLGQTAVLSATSIALPDYPCKQTNVTLDRVDVNTLLQDDWKAKRGYLEIKPYKLGKMATHINSGCADGLVLDRNHLLMQDAGVFYIIERAE